MIENLVLVYIFSPSVSSISVGIIVLIIFNIFYVVFLFGLLSVVVMAIYCLMAEAIETEINFVSPNSAIYCLMFEAVNFFFFFLSCCDRIPINIFTRSLDCS